MEEQRIYGEIYQSPIGALTILSGDKGIKAIKFYEDEKVKAQGRTNEMTRNPQLRHVRCIGNASSGCEEPLLVQRNAGYLRSYRGTDAEAFRKL